MMQRGVAAAGLVCGALSALLAPSEARAAFTRTWAPFVLVGGLLAIGLLANDDGVFDAVGARVERRLHSDRALWIGSVAMIGLVTVVLNLDTSVAFVTPVLVFAARRRGCGEARLLYASLALANAGSLLLPGSNLTNLMVLGPLGLSGAGVARLTWAPALVAFVATAAVVAVIEPMNRLRPAGEPANGRQVQIPPAAFGAGLVAVVAAVVVVLTVPDPALPVAAIALAARAARTWQRGVDVRQLRSTLGAPLLVGLCGFAVALGTLARTWDGPARLLDAQGRLGTAAIGAVAALLVNNLPAAALFGATRPAHPVALLIGLNVGPNLFVTGSLAWIVWFRTAHTVGAEVSIRRAVRIGLVAVPLSLVASIAALVLVT